MSNFNLRRWRAAEAALGGAVVANQVQFHLLDQGPLREMLPFAQSEGRVIIAYSPLAKGVFGGRYDASNPPRDFRRGDAAFSAAAFAQIAALLEALRTIGGRHAATPAQVALAWLIQQGRVVAIPGARSVANRWKPTRRQQTSS